MSRSHDRSALAPVLGMVAAGALLGEARADEPEPLDEEFLDYLLQLEGDEEDWTLFDSQEAELVPTKSTTTTAKPAPIQEPVAKSTQSPPVQSPPAPNPPPVRARTEVKR